MHYEPGIRSRVGKTTGKNDRKKRPEKRQENNCYNSLTIILKCTFSDTPCPEPQCEPRLRADPYRPVANNFNLGKPDARQSGHKSGDRQSLKKTLLFHSYFQENSEFFCEFAQKFEEYRAGAYKKRPL